MNVLTDLKRQNGAQKAFEKCVRDIVSFFRVQMSDLQIDCMLKALEFYSKDPTGRKRYSVGTARKKQVSRRVREMAEKWAIGPYERLEALARNGLPGR